MHTAVNNNVTLLSNNSALELSSTSHKQVRSPKPTTGSGSSLSTNAKLNADDAGWNTSLSGGKDDLDCKATKKTVYKDTCYQAQFAYARDIALFYSQTYLSSTCLCTTRGKELGRRRIFWQAICRQDEGGEDAECGILRDLQVSPLRVASTSRHRSTGRKDPLKSFAGANLNARPDFQ